MRGLLKCANAALCLSIIAFGTPASAQAFATTKQTTVNVRDLDLRQARDVETVRNRISAAVAYVCDAPRDEVSARSGDSCIVGALAYANEQLDRALLQVRRSIVLARAVPPGGKQ
jgi:UrcA family protein